VRGLAKLIHRAYPSGEKEFCPRRKGFHIWSRYYCNASGGQKAPDVAEEANRAFDMLDDLDGSDEITGTWSKLGSEVVPIKVNGDMGQTSHKAISSPVDRKDVAT
jgi:hypothetical protein